MNTARELKPRLLWIGDCCVQTGFAEVTAAILDHLRENWDVQVIGINATGDPHKLPYPVYPARIGGDLWGLGRFRELVPALKPDAICIIQDPWIVARFMEFERDGVPMAAYMPVDAKNIPPQYCLALNKLELAIFYTKFGEVQCRGAGFTGKSAIIPHGADTELYRPIDKKTCRKRLNFSESLPADAFIVGNVNRNQPRKRLDLSVQYFAEWIKQRRITNAYLYLHCSQQEQAGYALGQLAHYHGIANRVILPAEDLMAPGEGFPAEQMPYVYGTFDVLISTTMGEGWGLSSSMAAACGIPQILPQYSALAEWMAGAARFVRCTAQASHIGINTIGGIADKIEFIEALDQMYHDPMLRSVYAEKALLRIKESRFRWTAVAAKFQEALNTMLVEHKTRLMAKKVEEESAKVAEAESEPELCPSL